MASVALMLLPRVPLRKLCENDRFFYMDRLEQYFRGTQDDGKRYDWNGSPRGMGGLEPLPMAPGFYVSLDRRRPSTRKRFARLVTASLTEMSVDGDAFPEINVDGDDAAQKALREWSKLMLLPQKMGEARDNGGQHGTACLSLGVIANAFAVDVHNAKHCTVLEWANRQKLLPARVLKAYLFKKPVFEGGERKVKDFWYVRYWDMSVDITWEAVPAELAEQPDWMDKIAPSFVGDHGFGFCPYYWTQNLPNSEEEDGDGDYEGLEDKFDEYNRLLSATTKGTTFNVDPTLVIKSEDDEQPVTKGSGAVIHSPGGAEFLELAGGSVKAALELMSELRVSILEECQVVRPRDEEAKSGMAQSAAAKRLQYAPMIARCNRLRPQYGSTLTRILEDVLKVARKVRAKPALQIMNDMGAVVMEHKETLTPDLDPGEVESVTLKWPPYFQPTSQDVKDTVSIAQAATGGKPLLSQKSGVDYVGHLFGVVDTDLELQEIEADADKDAERTAEALKTQVGIEGAGGDDKDGDE
jgi:hypothetical protein